jgi:hypothetical protein
MSILKSALLRRETMAICMPNSVGFDTSPKFFDLDAMAASVGRRAVACRCPACGSEVPYDSMVVSCRCSDEFDVPDLAMAHQRAAS